MKKTLGHRNYHSNRDKIKISFMMFHFSIYCMGVEDARVDGNNRLINIKFRQSSIYKPLWSYSHPQYIRRFCLI